MGVQVVLMGHELLFVGSHSQLLSHQASNSSRCSSSVIENSSSRPSWLSSFSVMTTSSQGVVGHSLLMGATSAGFKIAALRAKSNRAAHAAAEVFFNVRIVASDILTCCERAPKPSWHSPPGSWNPGESPGYGPGFLPLALKNRFLLRCVSDLHGPAASLRPQLEATRPDSCK